MTAHTRPAGQPYSLAAFIELPEEDGYCLELSRGELVREPAPGPRHGRVAARVYRALWQAGERVGMGEVFFDTGFLLAEDPPTVRVPDVAFVSAARVPRVTPSRGFWALAPDLAVEVVSPSSSASDMQRKALTYLDGGSHEVWIVDPGSATVTVYRSRSDIRVLERGDTLEGGEMLPELQIDVSALFD
jgi:Uma2 family endonuclease